MVLPVMRRPPQDAFLRGTLRQKSHRELRGTSQPVAPVPKVTVVPGRDSKHPDRVRCQKPKHQRRRYRRPVYEDNGQMKQDEEQDRSKAVARVR